MKNKFKDLKQSIFRIRKVAVVLLFMVSVNLAYPHLVSAQTDYTGSLSLSKSTTKLQGEATEVAKIAAIVMGVGILIGLVTVIIMFALKKEQAKEYGVYLVIAIVIYTLFFKSVVAELITGASLVAP